MNRTLLRLYQGSILAVVAYAFIWNRELPKAHALVTDCSTPLDTADTIYQLSTTTVGNCIITANNITIDGQGLHSVNGNIESTGGHNIVVTDVVLVDGFVKSEGVTGTAGTVSVTNTEVTGYVSSYSAIYDTSPVIVTNSVIGLAVSSISYYGGANGDNVTIVDSVVVGGVASYSYSGDGGDIVIENSEVGLVTTGTYGDSGGNITISSNSVVNGNVYSEGFSGSGFIEVTDSVVNGFVDTRSQLAAGNVTIENSEINEHVRSFASAEDSGDVTVTDSDIANYVRSQGAVNSGTVSITDSDVGGRVQSVGYTGNGGDVSVDNSTLGNWVYAGGSIDAGNITVTDSDVALGVSSFTYGNNGGDVSVTNSTVGNYVSSYGYYGDAGDVTVTNSTVLAGSYSRGVTASSLHGLGGNVFITDSSISGYSLGASLTLIDNPPSLTVTPLEIDIDFDKVFDTDFGTVSAIDVKDGNLTDDIEVTGAVLEEAGVYELEYSVTDSGTTLTFNSVSTSSTPSTVSLTRTITREAEVNGSTSSGTSASGRAKKLLEQGKVEEAKEIEERFDLPNTNPLLAIRARLELILNTYLKVTGSPFDPTPKDLTLSDTGPDVIKLQTLLIRLSYSIPSGATGYFGPETKTALSNYQKIHNITPSEGYFGPKTKTEMKQTDVAWW